MRAAVSVIVPAYNAEKTLRKCIDSILTQIDNQLEVVLVDDGSTDQTGMLCEALAGRDQRIKVIHQTNQGVSAARNKGIAAAAGDYITFVDADDELLPNAIGRMLQKAEEKCADLVIGQFAQCGPDNKDCIEEVTFPQDVLCAEGFLRLVLEDHPAGYSSCRILYKASFVKGILFTEGRTVNEDSFFVFQCALRKPTVTFLHEPVYRCRYNAESVTHSGFSEKKYDDMFFFLERKRELIEKTEPDFKEAFYNLIVKCHMNLLQNMCKTHGTQWRERKKRSVSEFHKYKQYFIPAIRQDRRMFFILSHGLYSTYCFLLSVKNKF